MPSLSFGPEKAQSNDLGMVVRIQSSVEYCCIGSFSEKNKIARDESVQEIPC